MQQLPKGYYAVQSDLVNASQTTFTYRGVTYAVTLGVNLFATAAEAYAAATEAPDAVLEGLPYECFTAPVFLFSAGEHAIGRRSADRVQITGSCIFLGEGAGISPNLAARDGEAPAENPARTANESVLRGGLWYGKIAMAGGSPAELVLMDGFTFDRCRFGDRRSASGDRLCQYIFRNIRHKGNCGDDFYVFDPVTADTALRRHVTLENIRVADFSDLGYGGLFAKINAERLTLRGVCIDGDRQLLGLSNMSRSFSNCPQNADSTEITLSDCYFGRIGGENGFAVATPDAGERAVHITAESCTFVDASRVGEAFLQPELANERCTLTVRDCRFTDTRGNGAAIAVRGSGEAISIENCSFAGFERTWERVAPPLTEAPDYIEAHAADWRTDAADPHTVIGTESADYAALDAKYAGCRAYYGDQHVHTDCGGTSDGKTPMREFPAKMDELGLDFAAVVDHRQMRGFFLPEWDEERFIIGTEPSAAISGLESIYPNEIHYNMLFPHKYGLAMVLANFPEYQFHGDELTGRFGYPKFTKERLAELTAYVQSIGGMMVHPHPKALLGSDEPLDYYFGEGMYLEVMVDDYASHASVRSYELWCDLLALGKHVYAAGGSDTHSAVTNRCVSTFYAKEKSGKAFFDVMHSADYAVGAFGMQMCVGDTPMGGEVAYRDGLTLALRVGDPFAPACKGDTVYELRVITDRGVAYASRFNGKEPQTLSLAVQERKFYRAEVVDLTHGYRIAVGNPIWLK